MGMSHYFEVTQLIESVYIKITTKFKNARQ